LDATLCFVDECTTQEDSESSRDSSSKNDDLLEQWQSGDVGGFECYIEADGQDSAEAAEVYKTDYSEEEEPLLLSVSAACNTLSLVMRDSGVMRFVKYVSANAPGSRWDISAEYELDIDPHESDASSDSDEKDSEDSDEDSDDEDSESEI